MKATVTFRYSGIYNRQIQKWTDSSDGYPDREVLETYLVSVEKIWQRHGPVVLSLIEGRLGIPWEPKEHLCYIVGVGPSFSDPLTLKYFDDPQKGFDVLTHEMIHRYTIQREREIVNSPGWLRLMEQYASEPRLTRNHIPVHAMHKHVYMKMDRADRMQSEITNKKHDDYKRSWTIVESVGHEEILDILTEGVHS